MGGGPGSGLRKRRQVSREGTEMAEKTARDPMPGLLQVQERVRQLRSEGGRLLQLVRKEASEFVSGDRKGAAQRLAGEANRLRLEARKRAEDAIKKTVSRSSLSSLVEQWLSRLGKEVGRRLGLVSRQELDEIRQRLAELEKRIEASNQAA